MRAGILFSLTMLASVWWSSEPEQAPAWPTTAPGPEPAVWCAAPPRSQWEPDRKEPSLARFSAAPTRHYPVTLFHQHTRELLPVLSLPEDGTLSRFLRCRVTGQSHPMDRRLVEVAIATAGHFGARRVEIVSGYRSPKFNELWRKKGHQVSPRSKHMQGRALDFHLPGTHAREVSAYLRRVHPGGVGTYLKSDFVHVDFGPKRQWGGT